LDIPKTASASGQVNNNSQSLNITWLNKDNTSNHFIIWFMKNSTDNRYMVRNITVSVTPTKEMFPGIKGKLKMYLYIYLCIYLWLYLWYCQYIRVYSVNVELEVVVM
jgi:hypothetical protein